MSTNMDDLGDWGTSGTITEWARGGEQYPQRKYKKGNYSRGLSLFLFYFFMCLIVALFGEEIISNLLSLIM